MSFIRSIFFGDPPAAPDYTPMANAQTEVARLNIAAAKEASDSLAVDRKRMLDLTEKSSAQQMGIAQKESDRADSYYEDYQTNTKPINKKISDQAIRFSSADEQERIAKTAGADVQASFSQAREQQKRDFDRRGINPNSGKFADTNNALMISQAAASAGAINQSRAMAVDRGNAALSNAANVGNRLPGVSQNSNNLSLQGSSGAVTSSNQTQQQINTGYQIPSQYYNNAGNAYTGAANMYNMGRNNASRNFETESKQMSSLLDFGGAMLGMRRVSAASGGAIEGPGTGISDSIPARLSDGEYVIPADVVRAKGIAFFDKMLKQHHMPADQQKRLYGIRGRP